MLKKTMKDPLVQGIFLEKFVNVLNADLNYKKVAWHALIVGLSVSLGSRIYG